MPNLRGGKAYKKSKGKSKADDDLLNVQFIDKESDQLVGRLVKLLGNLNATVFCEDNKQRICKIRASIKKRVRFEAGDIVLVSLRDCEMSKSELNNGIRADRGDIIAKYHPQQFTKLKEDGINARLFIDIETVTEVAALIEGGNELRAEALIESKNDDFFEAQDGNEEDLNIDLI